jgi:hypothetical protein
LRDFYYLTEQETRDYLHNVAGGDAAANTNAQTEWTSDMQDSVRGAQEKAFSDFGSNVHDDTSWNDYWDQNYSGVEADQYKKRGAYVDQMQDIRKSLEFMQDYRYSDEGTLETSDFGMNEFEGSKEFRNNVDVGGFPIWENQNKVCNPMIGCHKVGYKVSNQDGLVEGGSLDDIQQVGLNKFGETKSNVWLTDELQRQLHTLGKLQSGAATSVGFDKTFGPLLKNFKQNEYDKNTYEPSSLYYDNQWEFGDVDTAEKLHSAIARIDAAGDGEHAGTPDYRNSDQRAYLAQKAYCRYLYGKVNQLGGYDYMMGSEVKSEKDHTIRDAKPWLWSPPTFRMWDRDRPPLGDMGLMYSEIDDKAGKYKEVVSAVNDIVHRTNYNDNPLWIQPKNVLSADNNLDVFREAGVISGTRDPDFIAGNMDPEKWMYDDENDQFVLKSVYYDEHDKPKEVDVEEGGIEGQTDDAWDDGEDDGDFDYGDEFDEGKIDAPEDEDDPFAKRRREREAQEAQKQKMRGKAVDEGDEGDAEGDEGDFEGDEADFEGDEGDFEGDEADFEGDEADFEGDEADFEGDEADFEGDDAGLETDEETEGDEAPQTVPDEHPGSTHIHGEPESVYTAYTSVQRPIQHFAPDATAPSRIPLSLIQSQIAQSTKTV